ncbi:GpE family phage tail protein [Acinetobacter sp. WCHAc010034]|nr:GpE family phage tail protein [Acinetobacter sp. WCHAc010034]
MVFHWTPRECEAWEIEELMQWNERARVRSQTD